MLGIKKILLTALLSATIVPTLASATENQVNAVVADKIFARSNANTNWKTAFLTGKAAQIVFMNITPQTNPANEIGIETNNDFDQLIFISAGNAKAILNGKTSMVKAGDMLFIPQGMEHNIINLDAKHPLKLISVYTGIDIPVNSVFKNKSDEHGH